MGIIIKNLIIIKREQQLVIAFIDNIDFAIDGKNCTEKMQKILNRYTALYKAMGEYIQYKKAVYYS